MSNCEECFVRKMIDNQLFKSIELKSFLDNKKTFIFKKGDSIIEEGDLAKGFYCINSGIFKTTILCPNGNNHILKLLSDGDIVGHRSIVSGENAHITVTAIVDSKVCYFPKENFLSATKASKEFFNFIFKDIAKQIGNASNEIAKNANYNVKENLAFLLLEIDQRFGTDNEGYLNVKLSRQEFSEILGTTPETTMRMISKFSQENLIIRSRKNIKIIDKKRLENIYKGIEK